MATDHPQGKTALVGARIVTMRDAATRREVIENGVVELQGTEGSITVFLAKPRFVEAIRLVGNFAPGDGNVARFHIAWRDSRNEDYVDARSRWHSLDRIDDSEHNIWATINGTIDEIEIRPAKRALRFRIKSLETLGVHRTNR